MSERLSLIVGSAAANLIANAGLGDCGFDVFQLLPMPITQSVIELRNQFVDFVEENIDICYQIFLKCSVDDANETLFYQVLADTRTPGDWVTTFHFVILSYCSNGHSNLRSWTA